MSWQPVSYWALRCDGAEPSGQCPQLLYSDPDALVVPVHWNRFGDVVYGPTLFSGGKQAELDAGWISQHGWTLAGERVLCPTHARELEQETAAAVDAVLEHHVEAEIDRLPLAFEEGTA